MEWVQLPQYEQKALEYAEKIGVVEYEVIKDKMIYYANYPTEHSTYKVTIELNNNNKEARQCMSKYYKKGNDNMYL